MGINTTRAKVAAFTLSGFLVGLVGASYAFQQVTIFPERLFDVDITVLMVVMVVIGGSGTVLGPLLGAVALQYLSEWLRQHYTNLHTFILGAIIIVAVILLPQGVVNYVREAARTRDFSLLAQRPAVPAVSDGGAAPETPGAGRSGTGPALRGAAGARGRLVHRPAWPDTRRHRPERRRQEHVHQPGDRAPPADLGSRSHRRPRHDRGQTVAVARAGVARTFQIVKPFRGMTVLDNVAVGILFGPRAPESCHTRSPRPTRCSTRSASVRSPTGHRAS